MAKELNSDEYSDDEMRNINRLIDNEPAQDEIDALLEELEDPEDIGIEELLRDIEGEPETILEELTDDPDKRDLMAELEEMIMGIDIEEKIKDFMEDRMLDDIFPPRIDIDTKLLDKIFDDETPEE